jgi:hypothetical protein
MGITQNQDSSKPVTLEWQRWTADDTRADDGALPLESVANGPILVRVAVRGSNVVCQYSTWTASETNDDIGWVTVASFPLDTAFGTGNTPDRAGLCSMSINAEAQFYALATKFSAPE